MCSYEKSTMFKIEPCNMFMFCLACVHIRFIKYVWHYMVQDTGKSFPGRISSYEKSTMFKKMFNYRIFFLKFHTNSLNKAENISYFRQNMAHMRKLLGLFRTAKKLGTVAGLNTTYSRKTWRYSTVVLYRILT